MKTYKNFEEDLEKAKANMELLQNIVSVGIPKKHGFRLHYHIKTICITSKY